MRYTSQGAEAAPPAQPAYPSMDKQGLRDVDRWKDKIEVRLDNRQVAFLFFGSALVACMLFILGVIVGKRLESRGRALAPEIEDPLALLDRVASTNQPEEGTRSSEPSPSGPPPARAKKAAPARGEAAPAARGEAASNRGEATPNRGEPASNRGEATPNRGEPASNRGEPASAIRGEPASAIRGETPLPAATPGPTPVAARSNPAPSSPRTESGPTTASRASNPAPEAAAVAPTPPAGRETAVRAVEPPAGKAPPAAPPQAERRGDILPPSFDSPAAPTSPPPTAAKARFMLQVGSFADRAEAEAFATTLATERPVVIQSEIPGKGTWFRVRLGAFQTFKEAVDAKMVFERRYNKIALVVGPL